MKTEKQCKTCQTSVHCCIFAKNNGFTFVSIKDALAIKKKTGKDFDYFLDFSPLPKKIVNSLKNDDPNLEGALRFSQLDKKKRILRLKTKKNGYCIFLNENRMCEIYGIRPNVCRIFPFWVMKLTNGKNIVIGHDSEPRCGMIKSIIKSERNIENSISKRKSSEIKKMFKKILIEDNNYKTKIDGFSKSF